VTGQLHCFLMSDLAGSSMLWETQPVAMSGAVTNLDAEVDSATEAHGGHVLKARGEGDSHFAVFSVASDAVLAACALQSRLVQPVNGLDLRARVAVHVGEVRAIGDDYYGVPVNQTARLRAIAHGGQTVISNVTASLAAHELGDRVVLRSLGHHRVRDFPRLEEVFQASSPCDTRTFPALQSGDSHGPALMAVAMADICGTSALFQDVSESDGAALQRKWATSMRSLGEVHGATLVKLLGDGCVAAFEDPLDCLAFAQDFRASAAVDGFDARVGADVGRVELANGEVIGTAVYRAHHLERHASPGEIALSALMRDLVGVSGCGGSRDRPDSSRDRASEP
jgi:class 3 adenylate cyclase